MGEAGGGSNGDQDAEDEQYDQEQAGVETILKH
jgi:hypothetical protein